jgi:4-hydroxy-2-oxoheptanedioate aldolase
VPGLDAVQVGPHDLTTSLGVPEQYDHPLYLEAIEKIIKTARSHGVGAAVHHWRSLEQHAAWSRMGSNLIMHSSDLMLFTGQLRKDIAWFREQFGETDAAPGGEAVV